MVKHITAEEPQSLKQCRLAQLPARTKQKQQLTIGRTGHKRDQEFPAIHHWTALPDFETLISLPCPV